MKSIENSIGSPPSAPRSPTYDHKWAICLTLFLGTLSVALSATAVDIAIPTIMSSLGSSLNKIQWVLTGFMITRTALLPSVGWLGDRLGDRGLFILSTSVFTLGSFLCGMSWSADSLIFFRIIQAIGAGPLIGVAMAIMYEAFPPQERGLAMGLFMTGWSLGPFFGPLLGGYLTEHVHWRAIFYINIPVGLLSIVAAFFVLPKMGVEQKKNPFDLPGAITMIAAIGMLLFALSQGQEMGWGSRYIVVLFAASSLFFLLFVILELRTRSPFVELRYFRSFTFSLSNLIIFFRVFGFRGTNFLISLFLQRGLNYSPIQAAFFLLPGAVITGIVSPVAGSISDRLNPRIPMVLGFIILIFTLYGLSTVTLWSSMAFIFFLLSMKSVGQSSLNAPLNTVALAALPTGTSRMGSGIIGMARGLGEAFGIAVLSFLLERYTYINLTYMSPVQGDRFSELQQLEATRHLGEFLTRAGLYGSALEDRAHSLLGRTLLGEAMTRAYQELFMLIAGIYLVLTFALFFLRSPKAATSK
ncbi:MAG: DHA2 family efflux MFS transporter permease subunit [Deltaproteobacteria bacterium]|nr:DHA2 family efflux MFS transporter permease subunit [Deltaproteobacteria bacterium]